MLKYKNHYIYILFCIILPVLLFLPLIFGHTLYYGSDMSFHVSRFYELAQNIRHGSWFPYVNTYSFNQAGVPLNLMYGILLIYPIAFTILITNDYIVGIYLGIAIVISLSMLISYACYYKYSNDRKKAFLFASLYNISIYFFELFIDGFNFGEATGMVFLPLVTYGIWLICKNRSQNYGWVYLAVGLSLTLYDHILSFVMFLGFTFLMIIIGVVFSDKSNVNILFDCLKSLILGTGLSMFFICGFVSIYFRNNMRLADHGQIVGINPVELITDTINNQYYIGALLLALFVIVLIHYRDLTAENRLTVILILIIVFIMTSYANFIWKIINHTPLTFIQWTGRLTVFVQLLVSLVVCDYVYTHWDLRNIWKYILFITTIVIFFMGNFVNWKTKVSAYPTINKEFTISNSFPYSNYNINKNKVLKNMITGNYRGVGSLDYLKTNSYNDAKSSRMNDFRINNNIQSIPNGVIIRYNSTEKRTLNTVFYDYTTYNVENNGVTVRANESHRGTLTIPVQKGYNKIMIRYKKPVIILFGQIISIISFLATIVLLMFQNKLRLV